MCLILRWSPSLSKHLYSGTQFKLDQPWRRSQFYNVTNYTTVTCLFHYCLFFFFIPLFKVVDFLCNVVCKQLFIFLMLLYIHSFSCNLTYCVALRQIGYMVLAQYFYIANNTWWVMWLLSSWLILLPQPFSGTHFRLSAHDIFFKCSSQVIFEHITTELLGKHEAYV